MRLLRGRCRVPEELPIFDEAPQAITTQAGNEVGGPLRWIDGVTSRSAPPPKRSKSMTRGSV